LYKNLPKFDDNSYAHFVTTRTYENRPYFKNEEFSNILLKEIRFYSEKYEFEVLGWVIMPDHVHLLLWWDKEERPNLTVSKIMQGIKAGAAMRIIGCLKSKGLEHLLQPTHREERLEVTQGKEVFQPTYKGGDGWERVLPATRNGRVGSKAHKRNLRYRLWQPGFYDFNVHSEEKLLEKLNYMHNNPLRAGLVSSPCDYEWSSYKKYFKEKNGQETI
jgi:putative transposase